MKKERIEDLGILSEKLRQVLDATFFEHCESKHGYDSWVQQFDKEETLYEVHMKVRYIKDCLDECLTIAIGDCE